MADFENGRPTMLASSLNCLTWLEACLSVYSELSSCFAVDQLVIFRNKPICLSVCLCPCHLDVLMTKER